VTAIVRRLFAVLPVMAVVALFVFLLRFAPGDRRRSPATTPPPIDRRRGTSSGSTGRW
jgi:hypothetical protein